MRALALSWRAFVCSDAGASLVSVGTVVGLLASPWPGCVRAFLCAFRLVAEVRAVGVCSRPFGAGSLPLGGCTAALLRLALARGGGAVPCGGGGGIAAAIAHVGWLGLGSALGE